MYNLSYVQAAPLSPPNANERAPDLNQRGLVMEIDAVALCHFSLAAAFLPLQTPQPCLLPPEITRGAALACARRRHVHPRCHEEKVASTREYART